MKTMRPLFFQEHSFYTFKLEYLRCVFKISLIQYCDKENVPGAILGSIFSKSAEKFEKHQR